MPVHSWNEGAIRTVIAEAAVEPSCWMAVLDEISESIGAAGAALIPVETGARPFGLMVSANVAELMDRYIREHWYQQDQRNRGIPKLLSTGITVDQDHTSPEEMRRSPFYNDLLGRCGFRWFAGVAFNAGEDSWCLALQRTPKQGPFSPAEQRRLVALRAPMTTSATIARELGFARAMGVSDAFEMMGTAAVLVDRHGGVIRTNKAADAKLGHDLRIVQGRLIANDHSVTNALKALIGRAIAGADNEITEVVSPIAIPRAGHRALAVYATPLAGVARDALASVRAIVVIRDLDECALPPEAHLRSFFNLTPAEAKLAMRVASGQQLELAADELGITYQTARNQMQAIFAKADVHRQAEIVRLFERLHGVVANTDVGVSG